MRKGINTLASYIQTEFDMDPFNQALFFFCGNSQDRFKLLYWDGEGFWLMYKRFENGKLNWPRKEHVLREMTFEQVNVVFGYKLPIFLQKSVLIMIKIVLQRKGFMQMYKTNFIMPLLEKLLRKSFTIVQI